MPPATKGDQRSSIAIVIGSFVWTIPTFVDYFPGQSKKRGRSEANSKSNGVYRKISPIYHGGTDDFL